jgi:hypothetical protein
MWRNGARSTGEPEARRSITSAKQSTTCGHTTLKACRKGLSSDDFLCSTTNGVPCSDSTKAVVIPY